jgi:VanZ family protein
MKRLSPGYTVLSLAYLGALFYMSSLPGSPTVSNTLWWRLAWNASHILLFACLALGLILAFRRWPARQRAVLVLAVGSAYALFDEWHQSWVLGRTMSLNDIGLDLTGILLVVILAGRPSLWRALR